MRIARFLSCAWFALPALASASCFSIYTPANVLIYQSTVNPIDLSLPITQGLRRRFRGDHLVMDPNESSCTEVGAGSSSARAGQGQTARARNSTRIDELSSLLRTGRSPMDPSSDVDDSSSSIELASDPVVLPRTRGLRSRSGASGPPVPTVDTTNRLR